LGVVEDADIFIENIEKNRSSLKQKRIKKKNITHCEFTNIVINDFTRVQFAHLDSIVYNPYKALDIENGVIIFSEIHADMTRLGIHTYEETYKYCESKGYLVDWA
jgi:alanine racemase